MRIRFALLCVTLWCLAGIATPYALASPPPVAHPSITIISPQNGSVLRGSTITVHVAVSHFKLVKPKLLEPPFWKTIPLLKGNQGHIHYLLDGKLLLLSGVVTATSHTWTNIPPGPHTITAYLATSQHAAFPGVPWATSHVTIVSAKPGARVGPPEATPSLRILGVRTQATGQGTTLSMSVAVSHFRLVKPILLPPSQWNTIPLLPGNEGHLHYMLDGSLILGHDVVARTVQSWTNVTAGPHTVTAYLANSRHETFPGTPLVQVGVVVPRGHLPGGGSKVRVVTLLPKTGGGAGGSTPGPNIVLLLVSAVLIALAVATLRIPKRR
jgi:hypothetical protein